MAKSGGKVVRKNIREILSGIILFIRHYKVLTFLTIKFIIMKEFMLIFCGADYGQLGFSPDKMQAQFDKWGTWIEGLKKDNTYVDGRPLKPGGKIVKGKQAVITDGPFAESKEVVGGFLIINANSLEEAAGISKGCPDMEYGCTVEVREVMKM